MTATFFPILVKSRLIKWNTCKIVIKLQLMSHLSYHLDDFKIIHKKNIYIYYDLIQRLNNSTVIAIFLLRNFESETNET